MALLIAARSAASSSASRFSRISCASAAKSCFSSPSTSSSPSSFYPPSPSSTSPFVKPSARSPLSAPPASRHVSDWRSPLSHRAVIRSSATVTERFERMFSSMATKNSYESILTSLAKPGGGEFGKYFSLPALNDPRIEKLPYSIRILLEAAIRNCDEFQVTTKDVEKIIDWENTSPKLVQIPFKPARVLLQDFTGVPAVVDLACMRDAMNKLGGDSNKINPLVPVDLVIDHSVQVDVTRSENAVQANMELEFQRNKDRFGFLKWGSTAFDNMLVVTPGSGIVHQVNVEYLARVVFNRGGLLYPDSVVGTDSHTTMVDGLGVAGWGVGGIEAEAVMLGQPMSMVLPGVVGFKLSGKLKNGVTATDLVLTVTQILRKHGVVGKFVEFYGEGMGELSLADRATIANMSPEYGATMGFFPVDNVTLQYLKLTGRSDETVAMIESYLRANKMFVDYSEPQTEKVYSSYLQLNFEDVDPCISGPKRLHDRVPLKEMKADWHSCLDSKVGFKGFDIPKESQAKVTKFSFEGKPAEIKHGDVVIAEITSCTNTSNPSVMLGAALVAKKACELGLEVKPWIKTSLAPGSRVVTKYMDKSGLQKYLNQLGFNIVGYGRTTCIGNSGDLSSNLIHHLIRRCATFPQALSLFNWWLSSSSNAVSTFSLIKPFNEMIDFAAKLRHFNLAWSLLDEMHARGVPITLDTFARIIRRYARARLLSEVVHAFRRMDDYGCPSNFAAFSATISLLSKNSLAADAISFFNQHKHRYPSSIVIYTTLIHACCRANRIDDARWLLHEMKDNNVNPNVYTYTVLIGALCRSRKYDLVDQVFTEMIESSGVKPNAATFNSMMREYIKMGQSKKVFNLFRKMSNMGCEPDILTFNCLIFAHCEHKNLAAAKKVINEMTRKGSCTPNAFSLNPILNLMLKGGDTNTNAAVTEFYMKMRHLNCKPNVITYNLLMQKFKDDKEKFLNVMKDMDGEEEGIERNLHSYNILISTLCKMGLCSQAYRLMCEMMEVRNLKPSESIIKLVLRCLRKSGEKKKIQDIVDKLRERGLTLRHTEKKEKSLPTNWVDELTKGV